MMIVRESPAPGHTACPGPHWPHPDMFRITPGSGQFLTWTKTHHATPQITSEFDNKINGSQTEYPGPHWPHPDMFRVPPGNWPVSDLDQHPLCDTSNHMRIR